MRAKNPCKSITVTDPSPIIKPASVKNVGINSLETLEDLFVGKVEFKHEHKIGDRVGQLIIIPYPQIEFEEVEELSETERGTGGYGSSGN